MNNTEKIHDTIIIGAGIAGLGCARTLSDAGKKFTIITEDIGGRIHTSEDGQVNYGAHLISADYDHVMPYVTKVKRLGMSDLRFHKRGHSYALIGPRVLHYGMQPLRLIKHLRKFRKAYAQFRKRSERMSQKEAIEADPYLSKLFHQSASEFAEEQNITKFCHAYLCEGLYPLVFATLDQVNAFLYLHFLQPLIMPMYTFILNKEEMIEPFKKSIIIDTVRSIEKKADYYEVRTKKEIHKAAHVVLATPVNVSKKLLNFTESKEGVDAYVIHVKGKLKEKYAKGEAQLFHAPEKIYALLKQVDGSILIYSKNKVPEFEKYFDSYEVIETKFWQPAEFMVGSVLLEAKRDKNLYMVGDCNIGGLEASFITGVYAANKIIGRKTSE